MSQKESFLQYLGIEKRYSPHTVRSYMNDLDSFFCFLSENGLSPDPSQVTSNDIRAWIVSMMEAGMSAVSAHRKISCLRSFYKWMRKEGLIKSDPLEKVVMPKRKKSLPSFVDERSMERLLDDIQFGDDFEGIRNRTIIEMFYLTGMRRAELIGLKLQDFDLDEGSIRVTGKRNKQRIIPVVASFMRHLEQYAGERKKIVGERVCDWFFITSKGNKLYDKLVYNIINKYLSVVTPIEKKSPHVLRHTFATHMLNRGADLNSIKELLGHANLSATQVYTHNTFEKLRKVYKKAHPRG